MSDAAKNWSPAEVRKLRYLAEVAHLPAAEIAAIIGRPYSGVLSKARRCAISLRLPVINPQTHRPRATWKLDIRVADLLRLYRDGARMRDIAAFYGATVSAINDWLRDLDEPRRPRGRPEGSGRKVIQWPERELAPATGRYQPRGLDMEAHR